MASPLKGIKVLELGQFIAGPFAGLQLADLGAEVIKVERPGRGDPFRDFGIGPEAQGYSHNFCAFNRNKRSLTLDLHDARGQEAFRKAATRADVVLENFRPGVMKRLGIGYDVLREPNPRLVYCSIAGFSEDGPYRDRPAYDAVGQAVSGMLSLFVDRDDPVIRGPTITDQVTGMQASAGILGALLERERTGLGARVEITMVEASMYLMPDAFTAYTQAGMVMSPESRSALSLSFAFVCSDGKMLGIHVSSTEKFWHALLAALERADIGQDPRFSHRPGRIRNFHALVDLLRPVFASRPRTHWMQRLIAHEVPAAEANSIPEAMNDAEVRHLGMFHQLDHSRYGNMTAMRRSVRINGEREEAPLPPPALGEHTDAVLREFGFDQTKIDGLRNAGVI